MILAAKIKKFLDSYRISYQVFSHAPTVTLLEAQQMLNIEMDQFIRSVLLEDDLGLILAVLPLNAKLDFARIEKRLKRQLKVVRREKADRLFYDCEPGSHPPLGEPYKIRTLIDCSLLKKSHVHFEPGTHTSVVRMSLSDYRFLTQGAVWAPISVPMDSPDTQDCHWEQSRDLLDDLIRIHNPCLEQIGKRIEATYPLPPLPSIAHQILDLTRKLSPSAKELAQIIHRDPNLSEWVLVYARWSAPELEDCHDVFEAIHHLGVELVGHMAIGIAAGRIFQGQEQGPIGLKAFWKHGFCSAMLCRALCLKSTYPDLDPSVAYLCGLLHNFGLLLMGHLFAPEFRMLNKMLLMNPKIPIEILEKKILGMGQARQVIGSGHAQMGAWLLQSWQMPPEVVVAAREHHHPSYQGPHQVYVKILMIASHLLKAQGLGDGVTCALAPEFLKQAGLTADSVEACCEGIFPLEKEDAPFMTGISR